MDKQLHQDGGHKPAPWVFGILVGLYLRRQHDRPKPVASRSPLEGLDARQAMGAVSFGRAVGLVAMALFVGFDVYTMCRL